MFEASQLSCARGERTLFSNLSFSLSPGEWLHVQGSNGAGKTSLLRLVVGLSPVHTGQIFWCSQPAPSAEFRDALAYLGHHAAINEDLTPLENLHLASALDGYHATERVLMTALHTLGLKGREQLPVRVLSAGQKRRVLLARLICRPTKLWVLDEAFNALDTSAVALLGELITRHLAAGGMAILTSHQALPIANGRAITL